MGRRGPKPDPNRLPLVRFGVSLPSDAYDWLRCQAVSNSGLYGRPSLSRVVLALIQKEMGK